MELVLNLLWIIPTMIVLMLVKGFFSGSEIALVNADRIHLRHRASQGDRGAAAVLRSADNPELQLATTLVGTNVAIVALTTLGTLVLIDVFGEAGDLYAIVLLAPLFLVLTEVVPKSVCQQKADQLAPIVIWPLRTFMVLLFPVVFTFAAIARVAARLVGGSGAHHVYMSREKIRAVLDATEKVADVSPTTWSRLKRAVHLTDFTVGEVMIPMAEVTAVSHSETTARAVQLALARGHFRLPVYRDEVSAIVGVLPMDLWKLMKPDFMERPLSELLVEPEYVVAQQPVYELLPVLQAREDHMAIVVDEFGSAIGMVTLEDMQESVVGEIVGTGYHIAGFMHREKQAIEEQADDGSYVVGARMAVSEVNDLLAARLPTTAAHTIGGFVMARLRHLPREGEFIVASGYRFSVVESEGPIVRKVKIEPAS